MVKKKSGRTLNPADAHRKAMRQKEIKKNKMERKRVRTLVMVHKDTTKLEEEISRYRSLGLSNKEKRLDKNGKAKLKDLEDKLSKILATKKAHGVVLQKDKAYTPIHIHPSLTMSSEIGSAHGGSESSADDDSGSEYSDDESESETKQESDEDIPLPPGEPPVNESEDDLPDLPPGSPPINNEGSDDDLPDLPPGPPPSSNINDNGTATLSQSPGISRPPPFECRPSGPYLPQPGTFIYNGSPGSPSHLRPSIRLPPHPSSFPPITSGNQFLRPPPPPPLHMMQGQGSPQRQLDTSLSRPPPFSSHYGPPPPPPVQGVNKAPRDYTYSTDLFSQPIASDMTQTSPFKPTSAAPVIQAEPQVRNLQKELTTLIPTSLLRRKADSRKPKVARPIVNAAPNIDDGISLSTTAIKRNASTITLLQTQSDIDYHTAEHQKVSASVPPPAKKVKTKKKVDEYDKFMAEMQDLL